MPILPPYLKSITQLLFKALETDLINKALPPNKLKALLIDIQMIIRQYRTDYETNRVKIEEPAQLFKALEFTIQDVLLPQLQSPQYGMSLLEPVKLKLE